ncbi:MAG TPA: substrate-binding domain-containing protein, partial [Candidatus Wunengus sp. YC65]|uniref:substrate-binding domain-containing protein n=1 Tax=Candidatus Wunengus sp. YC65 TaxID=3367701 RepID=UPI004024E14C
AKLIEKLEKGDLDIVIATQKPDKKDFEFVKLADESFLLVGAVNISLPNFKKAKKEEQNILFEHWLTNQKWITYDTNLPIIRRFWLENFKKRPNIQPAMVIPNLHSIKKAVELGFGISLLPDYLCIEELNKNKIKVLWKGGALISNEIFLSYKKIDRNSEMIMQIKAELLKP